MGEISGSNWRGIERWLRLAPLAAIVGLGATWLHFFWAGSVALQVWPRSVSVVVPSIIASLALVALGFCCVKVFQTAGSSDLRRVLYTSLLVHAILLPALPLHSTDLFSYLAYGELSAHGLDMTQVGPSALSSSAFATLAQWQNTLSVYGPLANLLMAAIGHIGAALGSPVWGAGIAYKLMSGTLDLLSILLIYAVVRKTASAAGVRGLALFGLNPLLAWEVMSQAHNDGLIVVGAAGYLAAATYRQEALGVTSLVLGTLSKFVLAPTLGIHLWVTLRYSFPRAVALAALSLLIIIVVSAPFWSPGATLATWIPMLRQGAYPDYYAATSIYSVLWRLISMVASSEAVHAASFEMWKWFGRMVVLGVLVWVLSRVRTVRDVPFASLLVLLSVLATAVVYAPWYVTWLLPFAAVLHDRRWQALVLGISVVAAPSLGIPALWIVLPLTQVAALIALALWAGEFQPAPERETL
jgi:hypothetical protein